MSVARLTVVTLGVRDFGRMREFYRGLGWAESTATENFAAFNTAGALLTLYAPSALAADAGLPEPEPSSDFRGVTLALNVETSERVDEVHREWLAAGARELAPPTERDFGGRTSYVADPEGNVWEIAWTPAAVFDDRGALRSL